jgi:hypothetical protein
MKPDILYEKLFCTSLAETIVVETIIITFIIKLIFRVSKKDLHTGRILIAGIVPSLATLPYFWLLAPAFISSFMVRNIVCEIVITLAEIVILKFLLPVSWFKSGVLSLAANCGSIAAGLILTKIFGI